MVARKYLTRFGEIRFAANAERYKIAQEATAGIKDVKLLGLEARYVRRFRQPGPADGAGRLGAHGDRPGAALPAAGRGLRRHAPDHPRHADRRRAPRSAPSCRCSRSTPSPACRLLPAVQQVYQEVTSMRYNQPALVSLHKDIMEIRARAAEPVEVEHASRCRCATGSSSSTCAIPIPLAEREALQGLEPQHPGAYHRRHRRQHRRRQDHRGRPDPRAPGDAEGHARGRRPADHRRRTSAPGRTTSATCRRRSS